MRESLSSERLRFAVWETGRCRRGLNPFFAALVCALALVASAAGPASAQPLDQRTVNLEGTWVAAPHDLFFQFSHRFQIVGQDVDVSDLFSNGKVVNYPTFALTYGLFSRAMLGVRYSSNSLIAGQANEWQPYLKVVPIRDAVGSRFSFSLLGAWNDATDSFDGELAAQFEEGPLMLIAAGRAYSNPFDRPAVEEESEFALAGGAKLKVNKYVALTADYANMFTQSDAQIGWSAGATMRIPYTPHTFGMFATNVTSGTLKGLSVGVDGTTFWGFEFTIRFSGHRWSELFNPREEPAAQRPQPAAQDAGVDPSTGGVVEVEIARLAFATKELTVPAGTTVRWVNRDQVPHTSTSDDGGWESPLLTPGQSFQFTFDQAGRYPYHCVLHPFMTATVIVTEGSDR
jgi:plastocyanin